ncbi:MULTISPECIES: response regulator transcription factor [unclassified Microbacterium]|uniref:response regulator transcription factor n=1 Tax=unclassified Microbacterium TaxID=2609290 RepID=UPI0004939FA4|nr:MULTISPECIES: response regulator transcription factor [unclassified Microbacterium]MCV0335450.1 response regulator transcription factor [Microbacterium sp.]MCV0375988.1 response regulator transcription factor [Microbacterium sp.]MCV0390244.1 response regulator transcription factor [Microbacterium sp.]MCV0417979.1 response regulator transcription factor [Microbacterium sp.]MCV0422353.1 response regulator transcription factor [Microbacterium sp.]
MIRVLIADDEAMIRSALAALLRLEDDIEVIAECEDGEQAVVEALRLQPDVCLLDLEMPGLDGVQVAEKLHRAIATRCVVVTRHARPGVLRRALASGVSGFLPKSRGADEVAAVIRRVAAGARYVDPEIAADALSDERSPLTDRELDVLRAGRRGETTGQIARSLALAPGTVRNHISVILGKLAVGTRQQAVLIAEERGWI